VYIAGDAGYSSPSAGFLLKNSPAQISIGKIGACYVPVDLNHPYILASSGLSPSEALPQFHMPLGVGLSVV
jgi:hypothetical protein